MAGQVPGSRTLRDVAKIVVDVMLKPEIHDPQGEAIAGACHRLGFTEVVAVRQGKRFEVEIGEPGDAGPAPDGSAADGSAADGSAADGSAADGSAADGSAADGSAADGSGAAEAGTDAMTIRVAELAAELLANPIIEEFAIHGP